MVILKQTRVFLYHGKNKFAKAWLILAHGVEGPVIYLYNDKNAKKLVKDKITVADNAENIRFGTTSHSIPNIPKVKDDENKLDSSCFIAISMTKTVKKKTTQVVLWLATDSTTELFQIVKLVSASMSKTPSPAPEPNSHSDSQALHLYTPRPFRPQNKWASYWDNPPTLGTRSSPPLARPIAHSVDHLEHIRKMEEENMKQKPKPDRTNSVPEFYSTVDDEDDDRHFANDSDSSDESESTKSVQHYRPHYGNPPRRESPPLNAVLRRESDLSQRPVYQRPQNIPYRSKPAAVRPNKVKKKTGPSEPVEPGRGRRDKRQPIEEQLSEQEYIINPYTSTVVQEKDPYKHRHPPGPAKPRHPHPHRYSPRQPSREVSRSPSVRTIQSTRSLRSLSINREQKIIFLDPPGRPEYDYPPVEHERIVPISVAPLATKPQPAQRSPRFASTGVQTEHPVQKYALIDDPEAGSPHAAKRLSECIDNLKLLSSQPEPDLDKFHRSDKNVFTEVGVDVGDLEDDRDRSRQPKLGDGAAPFNNNGSNNNNNAVYEVQRNEPLVTLIPSHDGTIHPSQSVSPDTGDI